MRGQRWLWNLRESNCKTFTLQPTNTEGVDFLLPALNSAVYIRCLSVRLVTSVRCWTQWTVLPGALTIRATTPPPWYQRRESCTLLQWSTSRDVTQSSTGAWGTCRHCAPPSTTPNGSTVNKAPHVFLTWVSVCVYQIFHFLLPWCVLQSLISCPFMKSAGLRTSSWEKPLLKTTAGRWFSPEWPGFVRTTWADVSFWRTLGPPSWRPDSTAPAQEKSPSITTSCRAPFTYQSRTWSMVSSLLMCEWSWLLLYFLRSKSLVYLKSKKLISDFQNTGLVLVRRSKLLFFSHICWELQRSILDYIFPSFRNSISASAVCAFNLSSITQAFNGPFRYQENPRTAWLSTPNPIPNFQVTNIFTWTKKNPNCYHTAVFSDNMVLIEFFLLPQFHSLSSEAYKRVFTRLTSISSLCEHRDCLLQSSTQKIAAQLHQIDQQ